MLDSRYSNKSQATELNEKVSKNQFNNICSQISEPEGSLHGLVCCEYPKKLFVLYHKQETSVSWGSILTAKVTQPVGWWEGSRWGERAAERISDWEATWQERVELSEKVGFRDLTRHVEIETNFEMSCSTTGTWGLESSKVWKLRGKWGRQRCWVDAAM